MNSRAMIVAVGIIVPLISGLLYWQFGIPPSNNLLGASAPSVKSVKDEEGNDYRTADGIDILSARLKARVEKNQDDGVGWALLARSYVETGRHAEAAPMYEKAMKLIPDDPQLLADYADALGMLQGRKLEGKAEGLIRQALTIDPNNVKALRLAGTLAFDRKDFKQAAQYWERAEGNLPTDTERVVRQELSAVIAEAKSMAGGRPAGTVPAAVSMPAGLGSRARAISGTVTLAPALKGKAASTDTLFVFARNENGPPMPLAIVRAMKRELPFAFRLDDSNSPMPARKLSEAGEVVIVARLSRSGEAMPKIGDLQGQSQPVKPGATKVNVIIDREIP